jgi:hypothetical protein
MTPEALDALIVRLRVTRVKDGLVVPPSADKLAAADALEGFAKMQQEGYLCRGHFNRSEPCPECVPLYRKGE